NPLAGGGADLDLVPLELVGAVDVLRGAGASRFGADALGGVVSFRSTAKEGATIAGDSNGGERASAAATAARGGWLLDAAAREEAGALVAEGGARWEEAGYDDPKPLLGVTPVHAAWRGESAQASLTARGGGAAVALAGGGDLRAESIDDAAAGGHARGVGGV